MAYRDYYNILGLNKNASQDEIKRAYRKLAMRWHPDKNPDNEQVVQRFKDITEAYQTLSDPERRARYDRLGPLYTESGRPPRPEELNEAVGTMLGNLFRRKKRDKPGTDLRYTISVSLEEVLTGVEKIIRIPRRARCATCGGDGAHAQGGRKPCEPCGGSGQTKGSRLLRSRCYHCDGHGYVVIKTCDTCDGEGLVGQEDSLKVKIPAGVATGQKLKLKGKGNAPKGSGPSGDLLVVMNVAEHTLFRRRGPDLVVDLPLTLSEVALGAEVEVPTLHGTTTIRVPPGTPSGQIFRLSKRGLPKVGQTGRGDLHLEVSIEVPIALSDPQNQALKQWSDSLSPQSHPRRTAFRVATRERK